MKVALIPLAIGSCATWLLAGPFRSLLERTLPLHFSATGAEAVGIAGTWTVAADVLAAPSTWLALGVVALGGALWAVRSPFKGITARFQPLRRAADAGYGFEAVNRGISRGIQGTGEGLRVTQSGLLNWNVAAIVMAVIVVLCVLWFFSGQGG